MQTSDHPSTFWTRWLLVAIVGVMVFGLILIIAPDLARQGFSLLVYANPERITSFGADAVAYISLLHAVLGSVMFGWGVALLFVIRGPFARGDSEGWKIIALSVFLWFVPDTAFSLWSGFWQNALLNIVLIILFVLPLAATYRVFHRTSA